MIYRRQTLKKEKTQIFKRVTVTACVICTCVVAGAMSITESNGETAKTVTTLGINSPSYAEISAFSYGTDSSFSQDISISEEEMIWMKQFMAHQNFDAGDNTTYLVPIKLFKVCLLSSNQEGLFLKVKNTDFIGARKGNKIQTFVEVIGNGSAKTGTQQFLYASSDEKSIFTNTKIQFFDKNQINTQKSSAFNTSTTFGTNITSTSALTNNEVTNSSHTRILATETMQALNHYSIVEGAVTADSNRTTPGANSNGKNFYMHESDFSNNTCGVGNSAVVQFAIYINIKDLMKAENDSYSTSSSYAMCTDATCSET